MVSSETLSEYASRGMTPEQVASDLEKDRKLLFAVAMKKTHGRREDAEDLVQMVMIKMISMADRVKDRGAIVGLAISSIKTTAIDMGRAASVRVNDRLYNTESEEITLNSAPHPTTPTADDIVESLVIHDIVESIRFERKRSLLAHVRGESMEDCSKAWGIPFHTHKNYIWRSYEEVRKKYGRSV